jgi:hypothetical protein
MTAAAFFGRGPAATDLRVPALEKNMRSNQYVNGNAT